MKICKKNLSTLSTGNLPVATTLSQIGQNKQWNLYTFLADFLDAPLPLKPIYIMDLWFLVQMNP